jgi:diguanylate cyclase (GGDEF)-like protein
MDKNPTAGPVFKIRKTVRDYLEKIIYQTSTEVFVAGFVNGYLMMLLLFLVGYRVNPNTHLILLYLIPIAVITLTAGRLNGIIAVVVAVMLDFLSGQHELSISALSFTPAWNTANFLVFFLVFALLLAELKRVKISERLLSRMDPRTGLFNGRHFTELVAQEIERGRRYKHPLTIAYIDCENLGQTSLLLGPMVEEEIILTTAGCLKRALRSTDSVAYFGGSEFGAVLPETDSGQAAATIRRVKDQLMDCTVENLWPVNYRIGFETFTEFAVPPDSMVKQAYLQMRREKTQPAAPTTEAAG